MMPGSLTVEKAQRLGFVVPVFPAWAWTSTASCAMKLLSRGSGSSGSKNIVSGSMGVCPPLQRKVPAMGSPSIVKEKRDWAEAWSIGWLKVTLITPVGPNWAKSSRGET